MGVEKKERVIFLVDMNAFYASVHQAEDPSLRHKPVLVGGARDTRKGIVLAKSYECLEIGPVKTAMTMKEALSLVPQAIVVRPDHDLYEAYAKRIRQVMAGFTPLVEPNSIDEAFLDMTGTQRLFGKPEQAAKLIQKAIYDEVGVASSIGIGQTKITAKMAADFKKPWGISTLWPNEIEQKLYPLPVSKLIGIGKKTSEKCYKLAIRTIGDLAKIDPFLFQEALGNMAEELILRAQGLGDDVVDPDRYADSKSIGNSRTFERNLTLWPQLADELYKLCNKTCLRLRKEKKQTRTISVSIKDSQFKVTSRARTIQDATDLTDEIYDVAKKLLKTLWQHEPVRLLGISLEQLEDRKTEQLCLFEETEQIQLQKTLDILQGKFGEASVRKGRLLE